MLVYFIIVATIAIDIFLHCCVMADQEFVKFLVPKPQTPNPISPTRRARGLSKSFIGRAIIGVSPFRVLITLLITY